IFPDPLHPRSVVVIPSLSLSQEILQKITGVQHYEERMLCMLMLLRLPRTHVIYVTSSPIDPTIISYYLRLLTGVPDTHARKRLTLLSCHDASPASITEKVLLRPRLMHRILEAIPNIDAAHMTCFNVTHLERTLAVRLGIPIYGCDPALCDLGRKSGSREALRAAGARILDGFERLADEAQLREALATLKGRNPGLRKAVVKLEEGTSGEGNAVFSFEDCPSSGPIETWVRERLPTHLLYEARGETWDSYRTKFAEMGGIVEIWIDHPDRRSPSVQCRIDPLGRVELVSTHDQILGGPSRQVFEGCTFPADPAYRMTIQEIGMKVAREMDRCHVLGRFGVDFVSVPTEDGWEHFAIEINLRKGGTTHPYMTLQFLTDGHYDPDQGLFLTPTGQPRYYYSTDNLHSDDYRHLTPEDLIDIAVDYGLHFDAAKQQGVAFHLIGALSEFGKLGLLCVAGGHDAALSLYENTVEILDREAVTMVDSGW
ncbi:MAG: peptide ligase PGM1-related protein, partial [Acidobacteriota bacterium]|nr:peptide ligase PGM1-related protein [Acidobacteriota bacterium]